MPADLIILTYVTFFLGSLNVKNERMIEELTMQASMISVPGTSSIKTLQTDI